MEGGGLCTHPSTAHHYDRPRGIVTCTLCGEVVNEEAFELDPSFNRGDKPAMPMRGTQGYARPQRGAHQGVSALARPSIEAARRALSAISRQLDIPPDHVEIAAGVYKMAVSTNCVVGARSPVLCACLYIVCRRKATPHMILDFSDVTGDSPFMIMKHLRVIASVTGTTVPPVDPSFYIIRLAQQLNLGGQTNEISLFALKILRSMKHDWIHTGRRPLGPCAAALVVACRAFGVNRQVSDVSELVRLGESTISSRLQEFLATDAAKLSDVDAIQQTDTSNPVAFTKGRSNDQDYSFMTSAMNLSSMYWELVGEARENQPATPERIEKWNSFWQKREELRKTSATAQPVPPMNVTDLTQLSAAEQLEHLGLPKAKVVEPKTEEEFTQELIALVGESQVKTELAGDTAAGTGGDKRDGAGTEGGLTALSFGDSRFGEESVHTGMQLQQPQANSQTGAAQPIGAAALPSDPSAAPRIKPRDKMEIIVLPPTEDDDSDDILAQYVVQDNEHRIQRQKIAERTYGEELWSRGAPKEQPNYEPEDPRFDSVAASRKRRRADVVESATAAEAIAKNLRGRGAGQIAVEGLAQLLGGAEGDKTGANTGSIGGSELESLDDEWPID